MAAPAGPPALVRGMFVTVAIHAQPQTALLRVPERAVQPGDKVWRVRSNMLNVVDVRVVEIVDEAAILQGINGSLRPGDEVVVTPLAEVSDGMPVEVKNVQTVPADAPAPNPVLPASRSMVEDKRA